MRAKYLFEWFPPIIEEELEEAKIKEVMDEFEKDLLKNEIGLHLFGDLFDITGVGNPELSSRHAGVLGSEVRKWQDKLTEKVVTAEDLK